ncbi:MAG: hypothetical protein MZU84_09295 [Sphingobacterium sp.]|nr:hypothetical protein [Sphingobacterium sp.]
MDYRQEPSRTSGPRTAPDIRSPSKRRPRTPGACTPERPSTAVVSYDVYAFNRFCADSYLGDDGGFITPAGMFMHVAGRLQDPVSVTVVPAPGWKAVSTGLDPVAGNPNTFAAPDFDTLYDCPILVGSQEVLTFEAAGKPHAVAAYDLGSFDRTRFTGDLKKIVEAAAALMGELPYRHYTFLVIGPGGGGLEHLNSTAVALNPASLATPRGYQGWLSFIAHEYFHLFNVKSIRPIAPRALRLRPRELHGPALVLRGRDRLLRIHAPQPGRPDDPRRGPGASRLDRRRLRERPGRRHQPAELSSFDTWTGFFGRNEHAAGTTISYYDIGCGLGLLLDLRIREASAGRASLDDVMRTLYRTYYKEKKRGFTGRELREVCEKAAGAPLDEIFDVYARTTRPWDYAKYLNPAGLAIDLEPRPAAEPWFGAADSGPERRSGHRDGRAGLPPLRWPGSAPRTRSWRSTASVSPCARSRGRSTGISPARRSVSFTPRRGATGETDVVLGQKREAAWRITPFTDPSAAQRALLDAWLK